MFELRLFMIVTVFQVSVMPLKAQTQRMPRSQKINQINQNSELLHEADMGHRGRASIAVKQLKVYHSKKLNLGS